MYTLLEEDMIAEEGLFGPTPVSKLLAAAEKQIAKKCKTMQDCDYWMEKVQHEYTILNDTLGEMVDLNQQFKAGNIEKKAWQAGIKAASAKLKTEACMLKLSDIVKKKDSITEEEIANLKNYIVGVTNIIQARKKEVNSALMNSAEVEGEPDETAAEALLDLNSGESVVIEGVTYIMNDDYELEPVQESIFTNIINKWKNKNMSKDEVAKMTLEDCLPIYAAFLKEKHGNRLVNDKAVYDDILDSTNEAVRTEGYNHEYKGIGGKWTAYGTVVKYGGQFFIRTKNNDNSGDKYNGYQYRYAVKGDNDNISWNLATGNTIRKKVIGELTQKKNAADKAQKLEEGLEAFIDFMLTTGQVDSAEEALDVLEDATGVRPESFGYAAEGIASSIKDNWDRSSAARKIGSSSKNNVKSMGKQAASLMKEAKPKKKTYYNAETCGEMITKLQQARQLWKKCLNIDVKLHEGQESYYQKKIDECNSMIDTWKQKKAEAREAAKNAKRVEKESAAASGSMDSVMSYAFDDPYGLTPAQEAAMDEIFGIEDEDDE